jgi:hypothetical protein
VRHRAGVHRRGPLHHQQGDQQTGTEPATTVATRVHAESLRWSAGLRFDFG